jgi:hypothetical protein
MRCQTKFRTVIIMGPRHPAHELRVRSMSTGQMSFPEFLNKRHAKSLRTGRLDSQEIYRSDAAGRIKSSDPIWIEPATFRLVAQCFETNCATACPAAVRVKWFNLLPPYVNIKSIHIVRTKYFVAENDNIRQSRETSGNRDLNYK